jgi:hypothetical protein
MMFGVILHIKNTAETKTLMIVNRLVISLLIPYRPTISHTTRYFCFLTELKQLRSDEVLKVVKITFLVGTSVGLKGLETGADELLRVDSVE